MVALASAVLPFFRNGFHWLPLMLFLMGMSFFVFTELVPQARNFGPVWSLFFFTWLGANLWANEIDYMYATIVGSFLWDMGSGAQGLYYNIHALSEPYGNGIVPWVVVLVDCVGTLVTLLFWFLRIDPEDIRIKINEKFNLALPSLKLTSDQKKKDLTNG